MVPFVFSTKTRRHEKECDESEQCEEMTERENEESTSDGKSDDSGERTGRNEVETAEEGGNDSKETEEMETAENNKRVPCVVMSQEGGPPSKTSEKCAQVECSRSRSSSCEI